MNRISLTPYREVLATPGVKMLLLGGLLARVPYAAMGLSLTLYIRFGLDLGYFEAGVAGALFVIGSAIGSTMHGRIADRYGIRLVLALATVSMGAFWLSVGTMSYPVLLAVALPAGVLNLPVFVVVRQPLAALIPERNRRTAYALDSTLVEITFMIGPAAATSMAAMVAPTVIPLAIGIWAPLAGAFLWWLNPRTRAPGEESSPHDRPTRRSWMTGPMLAMFLVGVGATVALGGTDMAVISLLEYSGQLQYAWIVLAVWAFYSMVGGFLLGASRRELSPVWLVAILGATTVPLGLTGQWWLLALALIPSGLVCAPTIATSVDKVSRLAPAAARGEAMGMHGSAVTLGIAVGGPLTGWVVDNIGVQWGFAAAGAGAVLAAVAAGALTRVSAHPRDRLSASA
ncbi:putative MFS family arabinose efflux permease [Stackebrandtia endophytica]|uniref:Putative MFS family arabinose efflux permease n=1 Tax=Stackebrandtia endophytica TaxID=1496996 RepID=A0A543AQK7_9ACTN|nr:MFS transporter [Stackebrandtia endophytica]TQL74815.1 putative MFS family arabinose efflux permease [Stackebrandtia endophytica]